MANDKDFKVKNGVKASAYYEAIGTVTSGTTVESNPSNWTSEAEFLVSSQDNTPVSCFIKSDGTKLYVMGSQTDKVYQYSLSTAWDVSTASYDSKSFSVTSQEPLPFGIFFSSDGTTLYVAGQSTDAVQYYTLSTAWDVSTATHGGQKSFVYTEVRGLWFSSDGTRMFVSNTDSTNVIYSWTLSTAWNVTTATYDNKSLDVSSVEGNPNAIALNSDGTKLYVGGDDSDSIHLYNLGTAYDLSTATYSNSSYSASQNIYGIFIKPDDTKVYYAETTTDKIHQLAASKATATLDLSTGSVFEVTADANVQIGLSNPAPSGTVSAATLVVHANADGFDIANLSGSGDQVNLSTLDCMYTSVATPALKGLFFKDDGTKFYATDDTNDNIYQYTMNRPPNLSSAVLTGQTYVGSQSPYASALFFKPDGTSFYITDVTNDTVLQYNLSTAWDLNSATYASKQLSVASQATYPEGLWFKPDGTIVYVGCTNTDAVYQYALSTAWDISTGSFTTQLSSVTNPVGAFLNTDGTKAYFGTSLAEYALSTAWDISTGTSTGVSPNSSLNRYEPRTAMTPSNGGKYLYFVNKTLAYPNKTYSATTQFNQTRVARMNFGKDVSVTYDSSISFSPGNTPTALNTGETRVLTFTTRDGGTTYLAQEIMKGIDDDV
jgi:DNA-binding beta-propeller fold protein YncE